MGAEAGGEEEGAGGGGAGERVGEREGEGVRACVVGSEGLPPAARSAPPAPRSRRPASTPSTPRSRRAGGAAEAGGFALSPPPAAPHPLRPIREPTLRPVPEAASGRGGRPWAFALFDWGV